MLGTEVERIAASGRDPGMLVPNGTCTGLERSRIETQQPFSRADQRPPLDVPVRALNPFDH